MLTARICARCRRPRACVRCASCLDLISTGTERCPRCAAALELEAVPERTYVPCPRCAFALSALTLAAGPVDECERCGGLFVAHPTMRALIDARRPAPRTPVEAPPTRGPFQSSYPPPAPGAPIAYLPCPTCGQRMNRKLFGQGSALVVDTCAIHGTWFDHGRLTTALAFVALGGLEAKQSATYARAAAKNGPGGAGASAQPSMTAPDARRRR